MTSLARVCVFIWAQRMKRRAPCCIVIVPGHDSCQRVLRCRRPGQKTSSYQYHNIRCTNPGHYLFKAVLVALTSVAALAGLRLATTKDTSSLFLIRNGRRIFSRSGLAATGESSKSTCIRHFLDAPCLPVRRDRSPCPEGAVTVFLPPDYSTWL